MLSFSCVLSRSVEGVHTPLLVQACWCARERERGGGGGGGHPCCRVYSSSGEARKHTCVMVSGGHHSFDASRIAMETVLPPPRVDQVRGVYQ